MYIPTLAGRVLYAIIYNIKYVIQIYKFITNK